MSGLLWKINRLRTMDPAEIVHRVAQLVHGKVQSLGLGLASTPTAPTGSSGKWITPCAPTAYDTPRYIQAADRILAGRFDVFALQDTTLGFPPEWNRDPRTGTRAPMTFGKSLDYRNEGLVGDIKYLWEPSRHLELVTLAQAWHLTGQARYLEGVRQLLTSWFDQCPYMKGVHWVSSLEHAVRLVNWTATWHLLGADRSPLFEGAEGSAFKRRWLDSIYQHCHFIHGHYSKHSSANNHLLGEYMGLLFGATTWPMWPESERWAQFAGEGFQREALRQNTEDGVNKEQAIYYHHEVMDMMVLCGALVRANGRDFSRDYWERLGRMMDFVHALMNASGEVPMIGDADDALMVRWDPAPGYSPYPDLLACGAWLFKRADLKAKAPDFGEKNLWLFGRAAADEFDRLPAQSRAPVTSFPLGGYYIMGSGFDTPNEIRAVVDCAPLGYLSIAAHGHADALALTLSVGGLEFLSDVGTYAYHTHKVWRDYFRSTRAHNTVCVDGLDQSVIGGNFMWLDKAQATCRTFTLDDDLQRFSGEHDGYQRLQDPVLHTRDIEFDPHSGVFEISDELRFTGHHLVEVCWNLHEECEVSQEGNTLHIARGGRTITLNTSSSGATLELVFLEGSENPPGGWISHRFDDKVPTRQCIWRGQFTGGAAVRTVIACSIWETTQDKVAP